MIKRTIFNDFSLNHLKGDLYGGLIAAIVSLPLALTFGVASGVGAEAGLYGAMIIGFFAAVFGGTPTLMSEPTGPMTVVMTAIVAKLMATHPEDGLAMAFTVVMMAGVFQIVFGSLKLGKYITMMPYSVISGFMSGIGIILIIIQIAPALGNSAPAGGVIGVLTNLEQLIRQAQLHEFMLFTATLAILFLTPKRIKQIIPAQLISLVLITLVSIFLLNGLEIRRIGEISIELPNVVFPTFTTEQLNSMIVDALVLGVLGCIDSMLTSVIADNMTNKEHRSNKELIGQGIGNTLSGLFGGLPGAGATMGTVVNIQAGARSALSGVIRVLMLLVMVFGAAHLIKHIPLAVLAGIAVKVGLDILDWSFMKRAHRVSKSSMLIMYAVLLMTVFIDLIVAVGIGVFIANVLTIEKLSTSQAKNIKAVSDIDDQLPLDPEQKTLLNQANGDILFFYLSGAMMFAMSKAMSRELQNISNYKVVIVDLSDVSFLDDTISLSIENMVRKSLIENRRVILLSRHNRFKDKMLDMGFDELLSADAFVSGRTDALIKAHHYLEEIRKERPLL